MSFQGIWIRVRLIYCRRFFLSTEPATEEDWEEVEGGESAENGPARAEEVSEPDVAEDDASKITLPDVPAGEPKDDGPAFKKQKGNDEDKF